MSLSTATASFPELEDVGDGGELARLSGERIEEDACVVERVVVASWLVAGQIPDSRGVFRAGIREVSEFPVEVIPGRFPFRRRDGLSER
ncbi:MAG: hypothetical protein EBU70_07365 [Actinobacteria bacterium]|nr:hypothetical protein [Actinomycetota bacterium]